jgi:hypothetical protein
MFDVFNRSRLHESTIRQALIQAGIAGATDRTSVAILEKRGDYSGRRVTFFSAFEPAHRDVVLASGHVEQDGTVVVNGRREAEGNTPARQATNRATHADDEHLVFWDADRAEVALSATATPCVDPPSTRDDSR